MCDKSKQQKNISMSQQDLRTIFVSLDKDGTGTLSAKEIFDGLSPHCPDITMNWVNNVVKSIDKNKDGQVSWEEFITSLG